MAENLRSLKSDTHCDCFCFTLGRKKGKSRLENEGIKVDEGEKGIKKEKRFGRKEDKGCDGGVSPSADTSF